METKLLAAAGKGSLHQMTSLLQRDVSVNSVVNGKTALTEATRNGHLDCVHQLLASGADVNLPLNSETPLMMALKVRDNDACINAILNAGDAIQNYARKNNLTTLMCAAIGGYSAAALELLNHAADIQEEISKCDSSRNTVLTYAAINGHVRFIRDVVIPYYSFPRVITRAIAKEDITGLRELLQSEVDVETQVNFHDESQVTPLALSVILDNVEMARLLLEHHADPDTVDVNGRHALIYAAACGSTRCLELLTSVGSTLSWVDRESRSALMLASENGHSDCLDLLIEAIKKETSSINKSRDGGDGSGGDAKERVNTCRFAVVAQREGYCAIQILSDTTDDGRFRVTRANREAAVDWGLPRAIRNSLNDPDNSGMTALKYACQRNHRECVRLLLTAGVDPSGKGCVSPLMVACQAGNIGIADELCQANVGVDEVDEKGYTALFHAVANDQRDVIHFLIKHGASVEVENDKKETLLSVAAISGFSESLECLLGYRCKYTEQFFNDSAKAAFVAAAKHGNTSCMLLLVQAGLGIDVRDSTGRSAVVRAVEGGHMECVEFLLRDLNTPLSFRTRRGQSVLGVACRVQVPVQLLNFLIAMGAPVDVPNWPSGVSPLMIACNKGNDTFVRILLDQGASTMTRDQGGHMAIVYAARGGNPTCVKLVIDIERRRGLAVNDLMHERALFLAIGWGHRGCIKAFIKMSAFKWQWYHRFSSHPFGDIKLLLSTLVNCSISPHYFWISKARYSPLKCALLKGDFDTVKYLLANLYLTEDDHKILPRDQHLRKKVNNYLPAHDREIFDAIFRRPWPLNTLGFLAVSSALSTNQNRLVPREDLVRSLPVPDAFKRRLAFQEPTARICPSDWSKLIQEPFCSPTDSCVLHVAHPDQRWARYSVPCLSSTCFCNEEGLVLESDS